MPLQLRAPRFEIGQAVQFRDGKVQWTVMERFYCRHRGYLYTLQPPVGIEFRDVQEWLLEPYLPKPPLRR